MAGRILEAGLHLLDRQLIDKHGRLAGKVDDVRLVQDGPVVGGFGASLRLDGLIVGRRAVGARLGYERRKMKGPLPVKLLFGWLYHDGRYVDWDRVASIEPERIMISGSVEDLPEPGASA